VFSVIMSSIDEDDRVRFTLFSTADSTDQKTTVILVHSVEVFSGPNAGLYGFALEHRYLKHHKELCDLPVIAGVIRSMKHRGQIRRGILRLTPEVRKLYFDEDENVVFKGDYLEETEKLEKSRASTATSTTPVASTTPIVVTPPRKPLQTIMKDAVIPKFNEEKSNASIWLESFEKECERLIVKEDEKPQALKLFLEGSALDWYDTNLILLEDTTWQSWKTEFVENFTVKGWTQSKYAINFRYIGGGLSEYARKKLKLLAETGKTLPDEWRIFMVIAGLPDNISCKIKIDRAKTVNGLIGEISQLEKQTPKNQSSKSSAKVTSKTEILNNQVDKKKFQTEIRPCRICEKAGKPGRFHPEAECFLAANAKSGRTFVNTNSKQKNFEKIVKVTNNTEIEDVLNNDNVPKN